MSSEGLKARRIVDRNGIEALVDAASNALQCKVLAIPSMTGDVNIYAWDGSQWVKVSCDATGKLKVLSS